MKASRTESIIQFEEGLIGFYDCKSFLFIESEDMAPFCWLRSTDRPDVGFLVVDPSLVTTGYRDLVPKREWESLGLADSSSGTILITCTIDTESGRGTGNLQAPLLVNSRTMVGKQVILTETGLTSRHPLL